MVGGTPPDSRQNAGVAQLIVRPLAEADIEGAFAWYERRSVALGVEFLRSVDACFGAIAEWPLAFPVVYRRVRRGLIRRFPYAVFYVVAGERVEILAVTHTSRHPRRWFRRA